MSRFIIKIPIYFKRIYIRSFSNFESSYKNFIFKNKEPPTNKIMTPNTKRFYGMYSNFNSSLILLQIVSMQALFYSGLSLFFIFFDFTFGLPLHFGQFFHFSSFNTDHSYGFISIASSFFNIPIIITGLIYIVVKANKVLDFVATIYFIHTLFCLFYNRLAFFNIGWIFINGVCFLTTVLVGEYICIKFEQQEIKFLENILSFVHKEISPSKKKGNKKEEKHNTGVCEIIELNEIKTQI